MQHSQGVLTLPLHPARRQVLLALIDEKLARLAQHRYFRACYGGTLSRERLIAVVKQLYCFSSYFERILARRLAQQCQGRGNTSLLQHARRHLSEELGHAELFGACLLDAGCTLADLRALEPQLMTKALYGYLLVAVEDENEYISNIAVFQVMEAIGQCFFAATMQAIQAHGLPQEVFAAHSDGDDGHALLSIEQCDGFDEEHMQRSALIIHDLFQLMPLVFDAWMGPE